MKQQGETCIIYALAMVLHTTPEKIIYALGHDGQSIMWPEVEKKLRGVHIQELQDLCYKAYACLLVPIEFRPRLAPAGRPDLATEILDSTVAMRRFMYYLNRFDGVVIGTSGDGPYATHAYAWVAGRLYDPALGREIKLHDIKIKECWIVLESNRYCRK